MSYQKMSEGVMQLGKSKTAPCVWSSIIWEYTVAEGYVQV